MSMTDRKSMVQPCNKHTKNGALRGCHRTNGLDKKASINKLKVDLCWFKWWEHFWQLERSACSSFQHHQNNFKQSYSRWFVGDTLSRNRKNISLQNVESQLSKLWPSMPSILVFGHIHPSIHPSVRPSIHLSIHPFFTSTWLNPHLFRPFTGWQGTCETQHRKQKMVLADSTSTMLLSLLQLASLMQKPLLSCHNSSICILQPHELAWHWKTSSSSNPSLIPTIPTLGKLQAPVTSAGPYNFNVW